MSAFRDGINRCQFCFRSKKELTPILLARPLQSFNIKRVTRIGNPMPDNTLLSDLVKVPSAARDIVWLKRALQLALRLEFATIPPYLCGRCGRSSPGVVTLTTCSRRS